MSARERSLAQAGPVAVAEELLLRAGCLRPGYPWVLEGALDTGRTVDFDVLAAHASLLDLSEEGVARVAVSLATGRPVDLRSAFGWLSRDHAALVMTAVAHAGGHDQPGSRIRLVGDRRLVEVAPPLASWGA